MSKIPQVGKPLCKAVIDDSGYITLYTPQGEKIKGIRKATLNTDYGDHPSVNVDLLVKTRED